MPWFTDEEHVIAQARGVGVPTPEVLGIEQVDYDGELLRVHGAARVRLGHMGGGDPLHHRTDLLRRGYARITDPDSATDGWTMRCRKP